MITLLNDRTIQRWSIKNEFECKRKLGCRIKQAGRTQQRVQREVVEEVAERKIGVGAGKETGAE